MAALPKFIDLSRDARINTLKSLASILEYAATQTFIKARIYGAEEEARSSPKGGTRIPVDNGILELKYGYLKVYADARRGLGMMDLIDVSAELDLCYSDSCIKRNSSRVKLGFDTDEYEGYYVKYIEPDGTGNIKKINFLTLNVDKGC